MKSLSLIALGVSLFIVGCIGDPGYSVTVKNTTGETVTLFVEEVNAPNGSAMAEGTRLGPAENDVNHWRIPEGSRDSRRAKVRAVGAGGRQVFCHRFGWDELQQLRFHIELKAGVADCT